MEKIPALEQASLEFEVPPRARHRTWRRFRSHHLAMFGSVVVIIVALMAICAPLLTQYNPVKNSISEANSPPSAKHWLGTDLYGRDVWTRLLYGGRVSLSVGIVAVSIFITIGTVLGGLSGYFGGRIDMLVQRLTEIVMTFPTLLIIITVISLIGPSVLNIFLVIGLFGWPGICRIVRAQFLSLRSMDYTVAAQSVGASTYRVIFRHLLPNTMAPIVVAATLGVASSILTETGLGFLGLGAPPPTPSWGNMINDATSLTVLEQRPWLWIPPGIMISACVLSINLVGDGLRDALDPRMSD